MKEKSARCVTNLADLFGLCLPRACPALFSLAHFFKKNGVGVGAGIASGRFFAFFWEKTRLSHFFEKNRVGVGVVVQTAFESGLYFTISNLSPATGLPWVSVRIA